MMSNIWKMTFCCISVLNGNLKEQAAETKEVVVVNNVCVKMLLLFHTQHQ